MLQLYILRKSKCSFIFYKLHLFSLDSPDNTITKGLLCEKVLLFIKGEKLRLVQSITEQHWSGSQCYMQRPRAHSSSDAWSPLT